VFDKGRKALRPIDYGDVLILVRRRNCCSTRSSGAQARRRPVGGADRLSLSDHIVFDDLVGLARFCLYPQDDLSLAAILRSPCSM